MTFNELLEQFSKQQIQRQQNGSAPPEFLDGSAREGLFEQIQTIPDETKGKLFDRTSTKEIKRFFDQVETFYHDIQKDTHVAALLHESPTKWFEESYAFMYEAVDFLEFTRYFAGGKTPYEKEMIFRSFISKLIKTQETVRTIKHQPEFLEKYVLAFPRLNAEYPKLLAQQLNLEKPLPAALSVAKALNELVTNLSIKCLKLMEELEVPIHETAQSAIKKNHHYNGLILSIRHAGEELFFDLPSDDYAVLVEGVTDLVSDSQIQGEVCLFQHVKREYMIDWLVHTLRKYDEEGKDGDNFYQKDKAEIYRLFPSMSLSGEHLDQLCDAGEIFNETLIEAETSGLRKLKETDFYNLLLRIYAHYKNDPNFVQDLPIPPQSLAASGDTNWEKKNMVAQAHKKAASLQKAGDTSPKARYLTSIFNAFKKASAAFTSTRKQVKAASKAPVTQKEATTETAEAPKPEAKPAFVPPLKVQHSGTPLVPMFPTDPKDVGNLIKGQKQDLSFNNSFNEGSVSPVEQEFFVNVFNVEGISNKDTLNMAYQTYADAITKILASYPEDTRQIQKKMASLGNVSSFIEDVLYLRTDEDVILTIGATNIGQNKNLAPAPEGRTCYFRLFVKGERMRSLPKLEVPSLFKEFPLPEKGTLFKEVNSVYFQQVPNLQALLLESFFRLVESLPEELYQELQQDLPVEKDVETEEKELGGFLEVLQKKAQQLIDKGVQFKRAA